MKNKKLILGLSIGLVVLIALFSALFILNRPNTEEGAKQIGVTVVFADKSEKEYTIKTDAEYLADARKAKTEYTYKRVSIVGNFNGVGNKPEEPIKKETIYNPNR